MKEKKVTYKELMQRLNFLFEKLIHIERTLNFAYTLQLKYIEMNGDTEKLTKFLEKETENERQASEDSSGTSGEVGSGDKKVKKAKQKIEKPTNNKSNHVSI